MKIVVQRSKAASVSVEGKTVGKIESGYVLLVCCEKGDSESTLKKAATKIIELRPFPDEQGKMNLNLAYYGGEILAISQFTLSWDGKKGNRPSFDNSMAPEKAALFFDKFCELLEQHSKVSRGLFGGKMEVSLTNWGPVTFSLSFQ